MSAIPSRLAPLRALWPFLRPYTGTLAAALVALAVAGVAMLVLPVSVRYVIDHGFLAAGSIDRYFLWLIAIAGVFAVSAALRYYLVSWLGERVVADLRAAVYAHVIRMSPSFFEITRSGEVLSRLGTDTTLVQSIAGVGISITLRSVLTLAGSLVMLTVTSPHLAGLILVLVPVVVVPLLLVGRRVRRLSRDSQDRIADTSNVANETLNAIETVQAFTLEGLQSDRYAHSVMGAFTTSVRRVRVRAWLTAIGIVLVFGAVVFVLWMGAHAVVAGRMSAGELGQFLLYAMFIAGAAASLSEMWGEVQRAAGAMERLVELLHATSAIVAPPRPRTLPEPGEGRLRFEAVGFSYPSRPGELALDDFTLEVNPGTTVALVGPSGAGKSTVIRLLLRFYDPTAGRILLDDIDIAAADPAAVRARIGLVPQETVVFAESALENIRYGRPGASDEEVRAAARAAAADEFIERLPQGYDTFLGERGARLSGGQRQRIAIARAILKDPEILLLDEATSSLDAESEQLVQAALAKLMHGRTTLVVAHRLATVVKAGRIVVVERGRIIAQGTHGELLRSSALYARLAALQFGEAA
ncbi:MAG: ATP-binding cassette domain-containing protein [Gammaproteobacteria bacterium]|nr:ATP-binding cassette domain-containing protein [Gammaproteobacteria bacterium]